MPIKRGSSVIIALALLLASGSALGEASLQVEVGWGGQYRAGRWVPLFVTVSDTTPRPVLIDVSAPHSMSHGVRIGMQVSASPTPATFPIYLPMPMSLMDLTVTLRDARTERRLAEWPSFGEQQRQTFASGTPTTLIGTCGRGPTMRSLPKPSNYLSVETPFIEPIKLPIQPVGYDALSALVLNQPDLNRLTLEQQQAMIDWVAAGGNLILWPSADPIPQANLIVRALPCEIGDNVEMRIDPKILEKFGLAARFGTVRGRELTPRPDAEAIAMFDDPAGPRAFRARRGFGQILVMPLDPGLFVFEQPAQATAFWKPLLAGIIELPDSDDPQAYYRSNLASTRRATAFNAIADVLGDVPGVGQFGFSYVAIALIALMIVVGPVDWFVLKYLGHQPWTWFTTTGWIVLVTTTAIFAGYWFKSGDLHFRTLSIIDQADGAVVGSVELASIYSPRTQYYDVRVPPESWWSPGSDYSWGARSTRSEIRFAQDWRGNHPQPMRVGVWSLRFLEGQSIVSGPPILDTKLQRRVDEQGKHHVVGTIANLSAHTLTNLKLRSSLQPQLTAQSDDAESDNAQPRLQVLFTQDPSLARIEPGKSININLPLGRESITIDHRSAGDLWLQANALAMDRDTQLEFMLSSRDDILCIYAEIEGAPATAKLSPAGLSANPLEKHWQFVRAIVPLKVEPAQ